MKEDKELLRFVKAHLAHPEIQTPPADLRRLPYNSGFSQKI